MPVTARLSQKFYQRLGEDIAQELVDWFNQVDATYRADLREFNELNFARFDAKLEQRLSELEAKLEIRMSALEARLETKMSTLETRLETKISTLTASMKALEATVDTKMSALETRLLRWSFLSTFTILGTMIALLKF